MQKPRFVVYLCHKETEAIKNWKSATFCIEYVEEACGGYRIVYIDVDDQND